MHIQKIFPFRLVTFDVTNTLLNFKAGIGKTYGEIASKHGVKCDKNQLTKNFIYNFKKTNIEHPNYGLKTGLSWQEWWKIIVSETFRDCQGITALKLDLIYLDLLELYKTSHCWEPATGALDLLNYLKARGVSLGIISNTDPRLHDILSNVKLNSYFEFVLTSYETGVTKPDNGIFVKAMGASKLENLEKNQCLHIGDNVELDYFGAKNVGWSSFLVIRRTPINELNKITNREHIFTDFKNLHDYLELHWNDYNVQ